MRAATIGYFGLLIFKAWVSKTMVRVLLMTLGLPLVVHGAIEFPLASVGK